MTSKAFGLAQLGNAYADGALSNRNKIINGAMTIDQRSAGAAVTPGDGAFCTDRFSAGLTQASKFSFQQVADAPVGFVNSIKVTSLSAYSVLAGDLFEIRQNIEGKNIADLGWGTANAKAVTLSFWVKSSLTGTFGAVLGNDSGRTYPFTYAISAADTWEYKTVTVPGDTSGTWLTTTGVGIRVRFSLGAGSNLSGTAGAWASLTLTSATGTTSVVGTSGATFYLTGVQLEAGDTATPFEHRSYGQELALCQRYFQTTYNQGFTAGSTASGQSGAIWSSVPTTNSYPNLGTWNFAVSMRTIPTVIGYNPNTGASGGFIGDSTSYTSLGIVAIGQRSATFFGSGVSVGTSTFVSVQATASAEL
jgi:hypothetical protein